MYRLPLVRVRFHSFSLVIAGLATLTMCGCPQTGGPIDNGNDNEPSTVCGDGIVEAPEECDDGNTADGDECSSDCSLERPLAACGDGVVDRAETCDDGNLDDGDGCSAICQIETPAPPRCGDDVVNGTEQCDSGSESQTCNANCTNTRCGDEIINLHAGEQCDDGNTLNEDGCSSVCHNEPPIPAECGNGTVDGTEECDGLGSATATCNVDCTTSQCGDAIVNTAANEQCDDGNTNPGDGCGATCLTETGGGGGGGGGGGPRCGDGVKNGTEQCDTGGQSATCNSNCTMARCGDGIVNTAANEQCDDGNTNSGDGCGATCQNEGGGIPNDDCAAAITVGDGTHRYGNAGATTDGPDEPPTCNFNGNTHVESDIWYCYTATCTGTAMASLCGSDYDTKLAVYDGCGCPTAVPLACSDDDCGSGAANFQSRVEFQATTGLSYMVRVGGFLGEQGDGRLTILCNQSDPCATGPRGCFTAAPPTPETPGCGDTSCCEEICSLDQFCCDVTWDETCAGEASGICTGGEGFPSCGSANPRSCNTSGTTPGCADEACCDEVCRVDPYCCLEEWDVTCVDEAGSICLLACGAAAGNRDCGSPHTTLPGCNDEACCEAVCAIDPFCCERAWDQTCVDTAAASPSCPP